jgi:hypothetical protein
VLEINTLKKECIKYKKKGYYNNNFEFSIKRYYFFLDLNLKIWCGKDILILKLNRINLFKSIKEQKK